MADEKNVSFTLQQMKEQGAVLFNIINEIKPILNNEEDTAEAKLVKICNLIGLMYGTADYTVKKMIEEKLESISSEQIISFGAEYITEFKKKNNIPETEE